MTRSAIAAFAWLVVLVGAVGWLALGPEDGVAGRIVAGIAGAVAGLGLVWPQFRNGEQPVAPAAEPGGEAEEGFREMAERLTEDNRRLNAQVEALQREHEKSEHYIDTLMDNVPANIYFKDRDSRFVRVNQSQARWLGRSHPADLVGKTDHDFFAKEHADQALEDERQIMETGEPIVGYVERETLTTGEEAWVLTTKMPFRSRGGDIIGTFGISNDVSELVSTQKTLERERNILRALIDSFPDHIYIKDHEGGFMVVNRAFATFAGVEDPYEMLGKTDFDYFPSDLAREFQQEDNEIFETGESLMNRDGRRRNAKGEERIVVTTKVPLVDEMGERYAIVGMNRDVTEQRQAREALLQSELQMQDIVDNSPAVICLKHIDGSYLLVNRQFERLFHVKRDEILGKDDYSIFEREAADMFRENDVLVADEGEPIQVEEMVPQDDGTHTYVSAKFPVRDLSGKVYAIGGVSTDITDRKRHEEALSKLNDELIRANDNLRNAQEQLIQAEKMESIGRLAAGVAHEVKNPLAMIGMGLEIVARRAAEDDQKLADAVERMRRGVERAKDIIKGLVDFSSAHQLKLEKQDLNDVVEEALALAKYQLKDGGVELIRDYANNLPPVEVDSTKVEQVLLNLCVNAVHAMEGGGSLTVRTRTGKLEGVERHEGARTERHLREGDRYVAVDLLDTGPGIDEEKFAKIFDPFFTTKATGVGTGLGLSVARKIVDLHHGMMEIVNREVGGVRATLTFKAASH